MLRCVEKKNKSSTIKRQSNDITVVVKGFRLTFIVCFFQFVFFTSSYQLRVDHNLMLCLYHKRVLIAQSTLRCVKVGWLVALVMRIMRNDDGSGNLVEKKK